MRRKALKVVVVVMVVLCLFGLFGLHAWYALWIDETFFGHSGDFRAVVLAMVTLPLAPLVIIREGMSQGWTNDLQGAAKVMGLIGISGLLAILAGAMSARLGD